MGKIIKLIIEDDKGKHFVGNVDLETLNSQKRAIEEAITKANSDKKSILVGLLMGLTNMLERITDYDQPIN